MKMSIVLLILLVISASNAENSVKCTNSSEPSLTFKPSEDNVEGRYTLEWCTQVDKDVTDWAMTLTYIDNRGPERCRNRTNGLPIGKPHSRFKLPVTIDLNCTQVCFTTFVDLIYNGTCYHIKMSIPAKSSFNVLHYITNNHTKEHFTKSKAEFHEQRDEDEVELLWYLGSIPATDYTVEISDKERGGWRAARCEALGRQRSEVRCRARAAPGCHRALLRHRAPWTSAPELFAGVTNIDHDFCVSEARVPRASSRSAARLWWWAAALGALLTGGTLLLWTVRRRLLGAWKRRVRDRWLADVSPMSRPEPPGGVILLLYARDCEPLEAAARELLQLLQAATGRRVVDVYSSAAVRQWARAGGDWLRLLLARPDTSVLLLQTPAGALLAAQLRDTAAGPTVVAGAAGAACRRPRAGDELLPLALRLLSAAPPPQPYTRHFVASIAGAEAEMAPGVTPLRRFVLPGAAAALLRALAPGPERPGPRPGLRRLELALRAFAEYARDHPQYLEDRLVLK